MSSTLKCELVAFVCYFLYGSFFEWAFHKYLFHSNRFIKATYRAHTLVHHLRYKYSPNSYEWHEGDKREKAHISMDWFALPLFLGVHLPFQLAIAYITRIPSVLGGVAAITAYYCIYEYFHYCMHIPGGRWFENLKPYTFAKEHHRIHHKHMLRNLNVYFPLADLCLGTFISAEKNRAQEAREAAAKASIEAIEREKVATH